MDKNNLKKFRLGSGKVYLTEFTGNIPEDAEIERDENILGYIQGGATVEYKATTYTAKDDLALLSETIVTDEEVLMKLGICTFNGNTLEKLSATARVTTEGRRRTLKVGGVQNDNGKKYLCRFVHKNKAKGDVRATIVGKNQAGFSLAYTKDKETVINPEFKADPMDDAGTLLQYDEDEPEAAEPASTEEPAST